METTNSFFEKWREANKGVKFPLDIVSQKLQGKEGLQKFSEALDRNEVKGTPRYSQAEYETVKEMDGWYSDISRKFQDYFYQKYYDSNAEGEVPEETIAKESSDFLDEQVKERGLDQIKFPNGKGFIENFRKYGYDENLLPDPSLGGDYYPEDDKYVTGLKLKKIFPFSTQPAWRRKIDPTSRKN